MFDSYLWKHFTPNKASYAYMMSIMMMVNEKCRQGLFAWGRIQVCLNDERLTFVWFVETFHNQNTEHFPAFMQLAFRLFKDHKMNAVDKAKYITFFINCFQSLEDSLVRKECLK